jgi:hypothetical protein
MSRATFLTLSLLLCSGWAIPGQQPVGDRLRIRVLQSGNFAYYVYEGGGESLTHCSISGSIQTYDLGMTTTAYPNLGMGCISYQTQPAGTRHVVETMLVLASDRNAYIIGCEKFVSAPPPGIGYSKTAQGLYVILAALEAYNSAMCRELRTGDTFEARWTSRGLTVTAFTGRAKAKEFTYAVLASKYLGAPDLAKPSPPHAPTQIGSGQTPSLGSSASLVNSDVVDMVKAGLSPNIIIAKIRACLCSFDTSPPALMGLKSAGVPEAVILAMVKTPGQATPKEVPAAPTAEPKIPLPQTTEAVKAEEAPPTWHQAKAVAHFYRERASPGAWVKWSIYADDVKIADLVNGRYFAAEIGPGMHVFRCGRKPESIQVRTDAGSEYYFRAELIIGFRRNGLRIVQVTKDQGEADVQRLRPLDPQHIAPAFRNSARN